MKKELKTGRDYRAELARRYLLLYEVAASVGIHPVRLGRMLREKEPITNRIRRKLDAFLKENSKPTKNQDKVEANGAKQSGKKEGRQGH